VVGGCLLGQQGLGQNGLGVLRFGAGSQGHVVVFGSRLDRTHVTYETYMDSGANCKLRAGRDELPLVQGSGGLQRRMPGRAERVAVLTVSIQSRTSAPDGWELVPTG